MSWIRILRLFLVCFVVRPLRRLLEKPPEKSHATKKKMPWWYLGFQFAFWCLFTYYLFFWKAKPHFDYSNLAFMGICLVIMLIQFIRAFYQQHAQFSIKSMMLLTLGVAILCSIYACFGFSVVIWVLLFAGVMISQWVQNKMANESKNNEKGNQPGEETGVIEINRE